MNVLLLLPSVLQLAAAGTVPTRPHIVRDAARPAIPTPTLVSDFKKNNVSAQWAPGYPMQWGTEEKKYVWPLQVGAYASFDTAVTSDEKFMIMMNSTSASTNLRIYRLSDNTIISQPSYNFTGLRASALLVRPVPSGGYDLLIPAEEDYVTYRNWQIRLDASGLPTNTTIVREGTITSFELTGGDSSASTISKDKRHFLASDGASTGIMFIYDFDNPAFNVTLSGHKDHVMSAVFSPNGQYVATASWDGYGKLWNATSGELVHDLGPYSGQNWLARFSPDGKQVLISICPGGKGNVTIWDMANLAKAPIGLGPYRDWVRSAVYSSDSAYLATGTAGEITIYRTSDWQVVQHWLMEDTSMEISELAWLEGTKRLTYAIMGGMEIYDFETNLKYRWGPGDLDRYEGGTGETIIVKSKGWVGGVEADQTVKFWKYPS